jgi:hypothetical protein
MPEFSANADTVRLVLDAQESQLLKQLTDEYRTVVTTERTGPVHDRLFPAAYDDPKNESSYRELTEDDLTTHKLEALEKVRSHVGKRRSDITIADDDFDDWLRCLTDIRLAIGARLDVDEERMSEHVSPRDPNAAALSVIHWLGWITEGLIQAQTDRLSPP